MQDIKKIAVLIDGNNVESQLIEQILNEAGKYGRLTVKRIYGDWSKHSMKEWIDQLSACAVHPVQTFACNADKTGTPTDLIIDAMDILRSHLVDGFCIVSSDCAGLANRIREEGLFIMGVGSSHTSEPFVKMCEPFIFTEVLTPASETQSEKKTEKAPERFSTEMPKLPGVKVVGQIDLNLVSSLKKSGAKPSGNKLVDDAYNMAINETTGMAALSLFNDTLRQTDPTFDYRILGFTSFRKFCESLSPKYTIVLHDDGVTMSLKKHH